MKFRMMLAALLLAAGLVSVTGCGKAKNGTDNAKTETKVATEADKAVEICKKFAAAMERSDFYNAAKYCTGDRERQVRLSGDCLREARLSGQPVAVEMFSFDKNTRLRVKDGVLEGDKVKVSVDRVKEDSSGNITKVEGYYMLRKNIDGEWKIYEEKFVSEKKGK